MSSIPFNRGKGPERPLPRLQATAPGRRKRFAGGAFLWILPAVVVLLVFRLYPMLETIRIAFTDTNLLDPDYAYVGFETFAIVLGSPEFWAMLRITSVFVFACVALQLGLGLVLALAIHRGVQRGLRGTIFTRVTVLAAWIIPGVIIGIIWKMLLVGARYGIVNHYLSALGFGAIPFLAAPTPALTSIIIANTWRGTAFSMIMQYAGLQRIPPELYEASEIDGAGPLGKFRHVTLPLLKPVVLVNLVLITVYTFNVFDMIVPLTGGGPGRSTEVIALYMYKTGFEFFQLGRAAAIALVMLVINVLMAVVYSRLLSGQGEAEV